tara:strand:- start:150 stop:1685 length:1536 start_codon:yes stop_codon:yes gene_type:complete
MAQLPNLARLSLTVTRMEYDDDYWYDDALVDEEGEPPSRRHKPGNSAPGNPPPPSPPPGGVPSSTHTTRFQDVDWRRIVESLKDYDNGKKSASFTVHVQELPNVTPPGRVWEIKMRLEREQPWEVVGNRSPRTLLLIEPPGAPGLGKRCVEIVLEDDTHETRTFYLNSLFYDLAEGRDTELCRREMLSLRDWTDPNAHSGMGAVVLQVLDTLAPLLATYRLELIDGSRFAPDSSRGNPDIMPSDMFMTDALALLRGYGYYEARGWFSSLLVRDPFITENGNSQRMSDHAHADLLWTEMVMTTPTNELVEAILDFPNTLAERWSDWSSSSSIEEGLSPTFRMRVYGKEACQRHADRAQVYVDEMVDWCRNDRMATQPPTERDQWWGKWMDHFDELSIRDIRLQTLEKLAEMEDARFLLVRNNRFVDVPLELVRIVELIDEFMENVWARRLAPETANDLAEEKYPSATLEKMIFKKGPGSRHQSLKIDPGTRTGRPKFILVENRADFLCDSFK